MQIYKFFEYISIFEKDQFSNVGIIGDSGVGLYKKLIPELKTFGHETTNGLSFGGWGTKKLSEALSKYKDIHPEINLLFIKIGDNDGYNLKGASKFILKITNEVKRIFPNAQFIVVKGGWGWGGLKRFTTSTEPPEMVEYYKFWQNQGFKVTRLSQGLTSNSAEAHSLHPGIRAQAAEMEEYMRNIGGLQDSYMNTIVGSGENSIETIKELEGYYGTLQNSINQNQTLSVQSSGNYKYSSLIEAIQVGLEYLGYDLPRYGSDGYYGPETSESIQKFKKDFNISTPGTIFTPEDTLVLLNTLKSKGFNEKDLKNVWKKSTELSSKELAEISGDSNDMNFIYYLPHQQGPDGSVKLLLAYLGLGKLNRFTRANNAAFLRGNCHDTDVKNGIFQAISMDDDQTAAKLFLDYQRKLWAKKSKEAPIEIEKPKHENVKKILDSVPSTLPKQFIYTVCYIESGFNPESNRNNSDSSFKGLFQMKESSVEERIRKIFPDEKPDVYNPKHNAYAGIQNLEQGVSYLKSKITSDNLAKLGLSSQIVV